MKQLAILFALVMTIQSHFKFKKTPNKFIVKPTPEVSFKYFAQKYKIDISGDLFDKRLEIFKQNLEEIEAHNRNPENTFRLRITPLSFLTAEERASYLGVANEDVDPNGNLEVDEELEEE